MYVSQIHIENLRCFARAEAELPYPGREDPSRPRFPNVTVLLGDNGAGKTTMLRAIALAALSPVISQAGYVPFNMVRQTKRRGAASAVISARLIFNPQDGVADTPGDVGIRTLIERIHDVERLRVDQEHSDLWDAMFDDSSPAFFIVGYGGSRRVEAAENVDLGARRKSRVLRYQRVAGLFEDHISLIPLPAWLPERREHSPDRHKQVVELINRLLPHGTYLTEELESGEYLFEHRGVLVPFSAMSDGYRAYIGWIADLLYHVCMGCPAGVQLVDNRGLVLVDEVGLHLHPEWQRTVVPCLSEVLPNLQFVLTTHSPIVAGTLNAANVRVVQIGTDGAATVDRCSDEIHGLNADQILLSGAFGLDSSRAPEFVTRLRQVAHKARSGDDDSALLLSRLFAEGAAGERPAELTKAPDWARAEARKRREAPAVPRKRPKRAKGKRHAPKKRTTKKKRR